MLLRGESILMLKHAADLSDTHEYFIVWCGDTNARPWGAKDDAYDLFPEFEHAVDGMTLTLALDANGPHTTGSTSTPVATIGVLESIEANEFAGCTVRMGSNTGLTLGYGVVQYHDAIDAGDLTGNMTIIWTIGSGSTGSADACYLVREDRKWGSYPNVRVLTPYQPVRGGDGSEESALAYPTATTFALGGRSLTQPAPYNGHATAPTAFEDIGVFLPFSFFEGIAGFGISEGDDSGGLGTAHLISDITGSVWEFGDTNALSAVDLLNGGYVLVDWEDSSVMKRSWAPITDSTTTTFTAGTWLGDGDVGAGNHAKVKRYTAWVPHFNDSPYAYLPGEGFSYPNHDMMPCSGGTVGANVHNRPRGITGSAYGDTFGAMLVAASRLSAAIGKRVNVVNLGVTDSLLVPSNSRNGSGFGSILGWWDHDDHGSWDVGSSSSIYARLDKLLRTVLPNALEAESSTKTLRCLGIVFVHGDTDALETGSRQHYGRTLRRFMTATRNLIDTLGYNPYDNGAQIPYVQPRVPYLPYAIDGTYARDTDRGGGTVTINADTLNLVNAAIEENATADGFAVSVKVDDLPRLSTDPGIYSGVGEAELGGRTGDQLSRLVDYGLGFGSTALTNTQTRLVDISNLALSNIGDAGQITSLTDGSQQAILCRRFLPEARDDLLEMRQWGFALRRRQLVSIRKPEPGLYQNWQYCYVMPADAMNSFAVVGPVIETTTEDFDYTAVTTSAYQTDFVANDGSGTAPAGSSPIPPAQIFAGTGGGSGVVVRDLSIDLPLLSDVELTPQSYSVEQSPAGHRYIFTNQSDATLQYIRKVVDADQYSSQFASALAAYLGSMLASAIIKGDKGEAVSARLLQKTAGYVRMASSSDGNQQRPVDSSRPFGFIPDHIAHRGVDYGRTGGGRNLANYPSGFTVD